MKQIDRIKRTRIRQLNKLTAAIACMENAESLGPHARKWRWSVIRFFY